MKYLLIIAMLFCFGCDKPEPTADPNITLPPKVVNPQPKPDRGVLIITVLPYPGDEDNGTQKRFDGVKVPAE